MQVIFKSAILRRPNLRGSNRQDAKAPRNPKDKPLFNIQHSTFSIFLLMAITWAGSAIAQTMPPDAAAPLYAAELGKSYVPADLPRLYAAHWLIEQYFASPTAADRAAVELKLAGTKLDTALLARLCRLRLGWQQLAPGVYYVNEQAGVYPVKYFLGVPKGYRRETAWPLVVKLPEADSFMANPPFDENQVAHMYIGWLNEELAAHPDALIAMPLLNLSELYGPSYAGMNSVFQPILNVAAKANVDPARVYLVGHAMAAHAAWNLALHYPTYLAAFCAMGGGANADWQRVRLMNLRNVLPVVWADTTDTAVPSSESGEIVSALRRLKIDVAYQQTSNLGHAPSPEIVQHLYQEMREKARDLYPKRITLQSDRPDTLFNRDDWLQVYQEIDSGNDRLLSIQHGSGVIRLNGNAFTIDATLNNNTVTMTTTNVESLRLYFNAGMIDFSKPVVVIANNRERFRGLLSESLDEMLKDQLFLGRGWRYFTSVLDLDLESNPGVPLPSPAPAAGGSGVSSAPPATRPHGRITVYNPDGSIQRVIEPP
jgi:hypothetical protein